MTPPPKTATAAISLLDTQPGQRLSVRSIQGGTHRIHRLAALGLLPGAELTVLRGGRGKPVVVDLRGQRLVIGRGMMGSVLVDRRS